MARNLAKITLHPYKYDDHNMQTTKGGWQQSRIVSIFLVETQLCPNRTVKRGISLCQQHLTIAHDIKLIFPTGNSEEVIMKKRQPAKSFQSQYETSTCRFSHFPGADWHQYGVDFLPQKPFRQRWLQSFFGIMGQIEIFATYVQGRRGDEKLYFEEIYLFCKRAVHFWLLPPARSNVK